MTEKTEKELVTSEAIVETYTSEEDVKEVVETHEEHVEPTEEDWKTLREVLLCYILTNQLTSQHT